MDPPANQNANPNGAINDRAFFCPACGAADVTSSALAGGAASCNVCNWRGTAEDLAVFRFSHDMGTPEEVFRAFFIEVRRLLGSKFATGIGLLLIKWGFLDEITERNKKDFTKKLARYVASASLAMTHSIIETRAAIEKERCRDAS
jgi:hypothetical protein